MTQGREVYWVLIKELKLSYCIGETILKYSVYTDIPIMVT